MKATTYDVLQAVLDNITDFVVVLGRKYDVICFNNIALTTLRLIHNKELHNGANYLDYVAGKNMTDFRSAFECALNGETITLERQIEIPREPTWYQLRFNPVYASDGELIGVAFTASNIDIRKRRELELENLGVRLSKFNRELTLLTRVNDQILSAQNECDLFNRVCRCIVESGGYRLAWVSYGGQGKDSLVLPVAAFGQTDYLTGIKISLTDPDLSKGPTARTLMARQRVVTNRVSESPGFRPWVAMAKKFGIEASIVLPLDFGGEEVGTINIYSGDEDAYDEHEVAILGRLAENLSLAVRGIRTRLEMERTKHMLKERVKELSAIYNVYNVLHDEITDKGATLSRIVPLLPSGWQYPEICCARITFDGVKYMANDYKETPWSQRADFQLSDGRFGSVEVAYLKEMPAEAEGPFLAEERELINTIASTIQVFFNKAAQRRLLEESEERFRAAFERSAIGMAIVSLKGGWLMVNDELCNITGYSCEEMLTGCFQDITHPEDLPADIDAIPKLAKGEMDLYRAEKRFIHKSGAIVWINLNVALLRNSAGMPVSHVAQIENVTERKESQMKFRDLVEQSQVGVYIVQDNNFVYANPWVIKEFGYLEEELIGHPIDNFIFEDDRTKAKANIEARLKKDVESVRYELRAIRKDGSIVWLELFGSITIFRGVTSIIGTMVDVTERKRLETERRQIIADLVQRNKEITEFTEIVSHNLRGPLSTVLGVCRMIGEIEDLADLKMISDGLLVNAEKLDKVVRELNTALSIKSSFTANVRSVALADVLEEVKRKHEEGVKAVSPDVIADFESGFMINTVASLFTDLISNIFSNCLLYRSPDRKCRIVISARKTPAEVTISITDNGIGINMELFGDKLFGLNKRFHNIGHGTGLGLFMSKAMVEVLNGSIGLESEVGVGTTVTIKLPA